ncbi:MAG: carboxymuconolactone decarboxylase family protein [Acidimicrobiia bacterium]|jgi:4-carboxymuconolactone decarboxylase|nr:carboxymuconolactone decarboxylase family protein [Acidimicrobiia bacterium]
MAEPDPDSTPAPEHDAARRARGLDVYREVYGDDMIAFEPGQVEFFDQMLANLFGDVWGRPALPIPSRRLLVIGVLAAQARFETLGTQLARTLDSGELTVEQVRETVIHLIPYVGYGSSSDLYRVSETAIAAYLKGTT